MSLLRVRIRLTHPGKDKIEADLLGEQYEGGKEKVTAWRYRSIRSENIEYIDEYADNPKLTMVILYNGEMFLSNELAEDVHNRWLEAKSKEPNYRDEDYEEEVDDNDNEG